MKQLFFFALGVIITITLATAPRLQNEPCNPKKSTAEAEFIQGFYVFTDSKPLKEFEFLGTISGAGAGAAFNPQYDVIRNKMLVKARKEYPKGDGVIFHLNAGGKDRADVIKFKD